MNALSFQAWGRGTFFEVTLYLCMYVLQGESETDYSCERKNTFLHPF